MADTEPGIVWKATQAATFEVGGELYSIVPGTTFADGHPVVAARREMFERFTPDYPWDGAPRNTSRADQRGARTR